MTFVCHVHACELTALFCSEQFLVYSVRVFCCTCASDCVMDWLIATACALGSLGAAVSATSGTVADTTNSERESAYGYGALCAPRGPLPPPLANAAVDAAMRVAAKRARFNKVVVFMIGS